MSGPKRKARKSDCLPEFGRDDDDGDQDGAFVYDGEPLDNTNLSTPTAELTPGLNTPNCKALKSSQKQRKAERKMAKSQSRIKVISTETISRIAAAMHHHPPGTSRSSSASYDSTLDAQSHPRPNSDGLVGSKLVADNIAYVAHTSEYYKSRIRKEYGGASKRAAAAGKAKTTTAAALAALASPAPTPTHAVGSEQMAAVLGRLNVKAVGVSASKDRKGLVAKLQDAVAHDLAIVDNEDRDTMVRQAGYFRYVNRRTYNAMIRNNLIWDWVSGRKLEEVEEEEEDDGEDGEDVGAEGGGDVGAGDEGACVDGKGSVVEDYGDDFEFEGLEVKLVDRFVVDAAACVDAPHELHGSGDLRSPVPVEAAACAIAQPIAPVPAREDFGLLLSESSVRKGLAEYVRNFHRTCDGYEDGDGEKKQAKAQEQEQRKAVDTSYAITNLAPEVPWD